MPIICAVSMAALLLLAPEMLPAGQVEGGESVPYANTPEEFAPYGDFGRVHRNLFPEPLPFLGPGAEDPEPEGIDEVAIGLLVPAQDTPDWLEGRGMKLGIVLATEEANAEGGIGGRPIRLLEHEDLPIWGASSNAIVRMAYEQKVWAIVGSVGGDSSHIAIRVALKAQVPVVNTATSDPTFTETGIPWAFRCVADDRQQSYALAQLMFVEMGLERVAILRSNDRYGRFGVGELRDAARRVGRPIVAEAQWRSDRDDFDSLVQRILHARPDGVVLWGGPAEAATALRLLRASDEEIPVFAPARLAFDRFLTEAGEAAEGMVVATTLDPTSDRPEWRQFRDRFERRFQEPPDAPAAHGYDGMSMLIEAVRRAGLNRVRIRNELAAVKEYAGVSGQIVFDNTFNDVGPVYLGTVENGRFVFRESGVFRTANARVIGLLRPLEGDQEAFGIAVERGVRLALEESDRPVVLEVAGTRGAWSTVGEVARDLIETRGAVGLVTALDAQGAHVAAQVATRLRRPIAVAGDSPALLAHTGVPWILTPAPVTVPAAEPSSKNRGKWVEPQFGKNPGAEVRSGYLAARRLLEHLDSGE
ncbi:MAG: ABC transporter substrate-binding protein [Acidobacteriota bacterium]